jgi:intergrase/recombinase
LFELALNDIAHKVRGIAKVSEEVTDAGVDLIGSVLSIRASYRFKDVDIDIVVKIEDTSIHRLQGIVWLLRLTDSDLRGR